MGHRLVGSIDAGILGSLVIGSLPSILIGSYAAVRLPEPMLRFTLAAVLAVGGGRLVF